MNAVNGKKTWIGLVAVGLGHALKAAATLVPDQAQFLDPVGAWLITIGSAFAAGGAAHKIVKGE